MTSAVPQGLVLCLTLFNFFVCNMDHGIKCTLSKFVRDTKLCSGVNMLEGRGAIQMDMDRRACVNLIKLYKGRFKVLRMDECSPKYKCRLGVEWIGSPE